MLYSPQLHSLCSHYNHVTSHTVSSASKSCNITWSVCTITHELVSWGILSIYDYYKLLLLNTSIPVEASMSRKTSTKFLTSLAALAFDTVLRNGLINLISPPSSKKQNDTHNQSTVASVTASRVHPSCLNKLSSTAIKKNDWQTKVILIFINL